MVLGMLDNYYGKWNWKNCWRITFILLLLAIMFITIDGCQQLGRYLGIAGGVCLILMFVIRFEDFVAFMDADDRKAKKKKRQCPKMTPLK